MTQYAKLSADLFYVIQETAILYNHYDSHYMALKRPLEVLLLGAIFFFGRGGGGPPVLINRQNRCSLDCLW